MLGAVLGFLAAGVLWFLHGAFIGMSNDYQMYSKYDPAESFQLKTYLLVPCSTAFWAWVFRKR